MASQFAPLVGRLKNQVGQLSLAQRVFSVLLTAAVVVAAIALGQWVSKPSMAPLFTNLSPADAAAIVDELNTAGVHYELTGGGGTILVPSNQLYDTRLAVAAAGLPASSDAGYALLDNMSMTSSEFQQQVTYQRALEGELAKTISAMDGVEAASVKLAIPQESVFVETTAAPTASVFVQTRAGAGLGASSVQAITNLVAASIEGMNAEDVAVIDSNGVVLSSVGADSSSIMQAGQVADYETRIASNVQTMLDSVLGPGKAVVSVSAELDYDKTATTTEIYTVPTEIPALSESTTLEEYSGNGTTDTGVLGPDNIAVPTDGTAGTGDYHKETAVRNNAVNKVTEVHEAAPGDVKRQSISVVVDEAAAGDISMTDLEEMVAAAAGIDEERGDVVSVSQMAFETATAEQAQVALEAAVAEQKATATRTMYIDISKWAGLSIVIIVVIVLIMRMARRAASDDRVTLSLEAVEELEARTQAALEARAQAVIAQAASVAGGELGAAPVPNMETVTGQVRDEIMAFAAAQPAEVAEVLRGWLTQGRQR